jgi:hypothetical protein
MKLDSTLHAQTSNSTSGVVSFIGFSFHVFIKVIEQISLNCVTLISGSSIGGFDKWLYAVKFLDCYIRGFAVDPLLLVAFTFESWDYIVVVNVLI